MSVVMEPLYYSFTYIRRISQARALYREQPLALQYVKARGLHYVPRNVSRQIMVDF